MNVELALAALDALLTLAEHANRAAGEINATIAKAKAEGRDLTDEELGSAIAARKAAEAALAAKLKGE